MLRMAARCWLVAPGDARALASGLSRLIDEPALRDSLGAAARRTVVNGYTWRAHVSRTLARLEEVVAARADEPRPTVKVSS